MPPIASRSRCSRQAVLALTLGATAVKVVIAASTDGTNDVFTFLRFGTFISENGLGAMYRADPEFNHVPLTALISVIASHLGNFGFWIRLPGIIADVGSVLALLRLRDLTGRPPDWALVLFAVSPVSLLIAGFHGNVDPLMVMAMLWAVVMTVEERPVASAVWFALAVNVKVAALLLAPLLILVWWHRGRSRSFVPTWASLTLLGWLPSIVVATPEFARQVLGYSNGWGAWGVTYIATLIGGTSMQPILEFNVFTPEQTLIVNVLKAATVLAAVGTAWWGRRAGGAAIFGYVALTWAVFFALAVGVGPQYLVWIAPFLVVAAPRLYAAVTAASLVFLLAFYGVTSGWRFDFAHSTYDLTDQWMPWSLVPWAVITLSIGLLVRQIIGERATVPRVQQT